MKEWLLACLGEIHRKPYRPCSSISGIDGPTDKNQYSSLWRCSGWEPGSPRDEEKIFCPKPCPGTGQVRKLREGMSFWFVITTFLKMSSFSAMEHIQNFFLLFSFWKITKFLSSPKMLMLCAFWEDQTNKQKNKTSLCGEPRESNPKALLF